MSNNPEKEIDIIIDRNNKHQVSPPFSTENTEACTVTSYIVKNNLCVLHLLSHEEAKVTIEQRKDTQRHPSPAHFPCDGNNWILFQFSYKDHASYLALATLTILLQIFLFYIFLIFYAKGKFPTNHIPMDTFLQIEQHNHQSFLLIAAILEN